MPTKEFRDASRGKMYNIPKFDKAEHDKMPAQMQNWYSKTRADKFKENEQAASNPRLLRILRHGRLSDRSFGSRF